MATLVSTTAQTATATSAGYEQDVFRMLRVMFGTAVRPSYDANGLVTDTTVQRAQYWPLASATSVLFDADPLLVRACDATHTPAELHREFDRLTVQSALMGAQVQLVVLAFSRSTPDMAVGDAQHQQAQRNLPTRQPSAMRSALMRSDGRRDKLLHDLLEHLVEACPLRPNTLLVVSGLTHLWWPDTQGHMPLCVRVCADGTHREVVPPWVALPDDVLDPLRVPLPRTPQEWFRSAESAVDHLKFWAMALRHRRRGKMCVVQCEEPRLLVELLALIETQAATLPPESQPDAADMSRIVLVHTTVAGYRAKAGSTSTPPELDRHAPVLVQEQVDVGSMSTLMGFALQGHAERAGLGAGPAVALLFALWLRPHHYNAQPFVRHLARASPCSAYQLWIDLLHHGATLQEPARTRALELDLSAGHPATMCDLLVPAVNYQPMAALLLALTKSASTPGQPDAWTGEAQMRAHAARLTLWLASALNCGPALCLPRADAAIESPEGVLMPTYGYVRRTDAQQAESDTRLAIADKLPPADKRQRYTVYAPSDQ